MYSLFTSRAGRGNGSGATVTIGPQCSWKGSSMSAFSGIGIPSAMSLLMCVSLGGCITSSANSSLMDARAEAPKPSASPSYMPVEDVPSDRKTPALTADEQSKLKKELSAVRDRQTEAAKAQH